MDTLWSFNMEIEKDDFIDSSNDFLEVKYKLFPKIIGLFVPILFWITLLFFDKKSKMILTFLILNIAIELLMVLIYFSTRAFAARTYKNKNREEMLVNIIDKGIVFVESGSESLMEWSSISKVLESKKHYFICTKDDEYVFIPKKAFANADDESKFRDFYHGYVETSD